MLKKVLKSLTGLTTIAKVDNLNIWIMTIVDHICLLEKKVESKN